MKTNLILLVVYLLAAALSVFLASAREPFSLWDVSFYLCVLGAGLSLRRILTRFEPQAPSSPHVP